MSDSISKIISELQVERNVMLEKMAQSAVEKWGIENVKLCQQTDNNYGKMTYWFEPIGQPAQPRTPRLVEAVDLLTDEWIANNFNVSPETVRIVTESLAREKKRSELVEAVIDVTREQAYINRRRGVQSKFTEVIDALDAYEKGE